MNNLKCNDGRRASKWPFEPAPKTEITFPGSVELQISLLPSPPYRVLDINTVACTEIPGRKLAILLFRIDTLENLYTAMEVGRSS